MRNFRIYVRESLFPRTKAEGGDGLAPLAIVGLADAYTTFDAIPRHNAVGSWSLTIPAGHPQSRMIQPGRGIVVFQEGESEPLFSGPITQIEKVWDSDNAGAGSVVATGVDDNYLMAERLAWTNPAADIHMASAFQYWQVNKDWPNTGELLRQLFLANTQGLAQRRLDRVFIPGPGSTAAFFNDDTARAARIRFDQPDQLVSLLSAIYGFRIRFIWHPNPSTVASNGDPEATGPGILLKLEPISNLTNDIRFGAELGNLRGFKYLTKAPKATRLVIATQNRTWREVTQTPTYDGNDVATGYTEVSVEKSGPERWHGYFANDVYDPEWWGNPDATPADKQHTLAWAEAGFTATETEWGITAERYKDRRDIPWQWVQDPTKPTGWAQDPPPWSSQYRAIQDEAESFYLDSGPTASISIDPLETDSTMFGVHYGLGDLIRVVIDGEVRDEIVREARLSSSAQDGPRVKPTLGTFGSGETPYLYGAIRALWDRVHNVEGREDLKHTLTDVPISDFDIRKAV
ncbi:hypothetical protein Ssi03_12880 [Sphaerisporangium siamense]|uniref:Gp28/Gp37-like domain-containing protein n=1 Tax=Sphaerisporangium siamense TaxID=795645 RepID=A0A7W7D9V5_9ACTN|nr:hypothetical protein [Sphaerisporangium siamense]MBB4702943.1 hypothetical protein [Sphaerisporangium siamense]GII83298.1 hypothetical protein Ssi03_12880 [Sphaerisporangium siamense]